MLHLRGMHPRSLALQSQQLSEQVVSTWFVNSSQIHFAIYSLAIQQYSDLGQYDRATALRGTRVSSCSSNEKIKEHGDVRSIEPHDFLAAIQTFQNPFLKFGQAYITNTVVAKESPPLTKQYVGCWLLCDSLLRCPILLFAPRFSGHTFSLAAPSVKIRSVWIWLAA
jgi:hypothetical protein